MGIMQRIFASCAMVKEALYFALTTYAALARPVFLLYNPFSDEGGIFLKIAYFFNPDGFVAGYLSNGQGDWTGGDLSWHLSKWSASWDRWFTIAHLVGDTSALVALA